MYGLLITCVSEAHGTDLDMSKPVLSAPHSAPGPPVVESCSILKNGELLRWRIVSPTSPLMPLMFRGISGNVGVCINYGVDHLFRSREPAPNWMISAGGGLGVILPALTTSRVVPTSDEYSVLYGGVANALRIY